MARPTKTPRWLTTPNAADTTIAVEATEAKKDAGFDDAERISAQGLNWLLWLIWKWIEWLVDGATGATMQIPASAGQTDSAATRWLLYTPRTGSLSQAAAWIPNGAAYLVFPIRMEVGRRILAVRAKVYGHTVETVNMLLFLHSTTISTQIGSTQTTTLSASVQQLALTGLTSTAVSGESFSAVFEASGAQGAVYSVEVDYDRP